MDKEKNSCSLLINQNENKFETFARIFISILMICISGFLTIVSIFHTTGMQIVHTGQGSDTVVNRIREGLEVVIYYNDDPFSNIIIMLYAMVLFFVFISKAKNIPLKAELLFVSVWTIVIGCIWVKSSMVAPSEDSFMVTNASMEFAKDNFSPIEDRYFKNYSFQLGYVLFNEIIIRIANIFTEVENMLFIEFLNVFFLAGTYNAIILINDRLFNDKRIRHLTVFILLFSIQPIIFCVFTYGIIPGLMFSVFAVYFEIIYIQENKKCFAVLSALFIAIAVMIKSNYTIVLIAMMAIMFVKLFSRKKFISDIIYMICAVTVALSVSPLVKSFYEHRSGIELGDSIPYISWIAMGLNEGEMAPGWYNYGYTTANFEIHNFNAESAGKASSENVKERIKYFSDYPQYRNDFFYKKMVSQWNETSYQSIWNNKIRNSYGEKGKIASWVCNEGEGSVKLYMDIYTQLIFLSVFAGTLYCLKNKNFLSVIFPLIILGGILYHLISEAKSQYAIPYFIIMTGFAPYGICSLYDYCSVKFNDNKYLSWIFLQK